MKFQKHQAIFANDATWADAVVRYGMLKKIIKSYHKSPKSPKPVQRKSDIVTAVSADPNNAVGGGILADWNNNNSYDGKEVEEEEEHEMITDIETLKNTLQAALDEDIAACNKQWANDVDTVRSFAKELQQLEGPPSEQKLQQLRLQIQNCFDYANLQERAFECIMRKWDKRINFGKQSSLSSESFLERLKLEPFMDANSLDEELVICQELMMRISAYIGGASNELDLSQELFDKRAVVDEIEIDRLKPSATHRFWLNMIDDAFTTKLKVPVIVVKGAHAGPVMCITACVHGNELNGVPLVHKLVDDVQPEELVGTIVAIPVVNGPGYLENKRGFSDNVDLNRCFPGKVDGPRSKQYAFTFMQKVVKHIDYLVDLHTASQGRANSLYVRADLLHPTSKRMALLQNPTIIVHNSSPGGSLRGSAQSLGIPAITVEIGDPSKLQLGMIRQAYRGVRNILTFLNMLTTEGATKPPKVDVILCTHSQWFYTDTGGILVVHPEVGVWIKKGHILATIFDSFGDRIKEYFAMEDAVVIGKSVNPCAFAGDRIVHLGFVGGSLKKNQADGHD